MSKIFSGDYRWLKLIAGITAVLAAVLFLIVAVNLLSHLDLVQPGMGRNGEAGADP